MKATPNDPLEAYFDQMRQLPLRLDAHLNNVSLAMHQISEDLGRKALKSCLDSTRFPAPIGFDTKTWDIYLSERLAGFNARLQSLWAPVLEGIAQSFRDLPPRIQVALRELGAHGWYMDVDMAIDAIWDLTEAMAKGRVDEAEAALCDYFTENLAKIEESIVGGFPHRAHLVRPAFDAHRRGEYALSVPVFIAQTDGICKDVTDKYLFIKARGTGRPGTAAYVEEVDEGTVFWAMLAPLAETLPISMSERERPVGFDGLNRHMVLHGESLDYDKRTSSLKAISLIGYVARVLRAGDYEGN